MLLVYSYCLGTCRRQWMLFWSPFVTVGEQFVKNTGSSTLKLITQLIKQFVLNLAYAPSDNPYGWLPASDWGEIHRFNVVGGANRSPWWQCLWGELCSCSTEILYYSYHKNPMGQDFRVPARTLILIVVKLLHTSPPWWCRLPLMRRGICGSAQLDTGDLFRRVSERALTLGLI